MSESSVRCLSCGADNPSTSATCRFCGNSLRKQVNSPSACPACGWDAEKGAVVCPSCGTNLPHVHTHDKVEPPPKAEECEHWSERPTHSIRTAKVGVGGILILLAGFLGITHALLSVMPETGQSILDTYESVIPQGEALNEILDTYEFYAGLMMFFGVMAVALSMFAFNRSRYAGAIAGGIFGVLAIGFLLGAFLGLVGLLLVATSKREFLPECR